MAAELSGSRTSACPRTVDHVDFRAHRNGVVRALGLAYVAIVLKRLVAHGVACYLDFACCKISNTCATQPQLTSVNSGYFARPCGRLESYNVLFFLAKLVAAWP